MSATWQIGNREMLVCFGCLRLVWCLSWAVCAHACAFCSVSSLGGGGGVSLSFGSTRLRMSSADIHPAVAGWPDKYAGALEEGGNAGGPQVLHQEFTVEKASEESLKRLDVANWPTWSTAGNPKWVVGKQNLNKVMPYGELSYVISGKLEIIPKCSEDAKIVEAGDFVTFPEGFTASWEVREELTWHYYLY
mmetsp:Transcript_38883/g.116920  ORF Transcript_38883/g.116920 Transcript_38883/m.116920 type:complete len:191 (-) Transcript_38883:660-1232(-)